jgi:hypothetical protein
MDTATLPVAVIGAGPVGLAAADAVELVLPETGVCSSGAAEAGSACCGAPEPTTLGEALPLLVGAAPSRARGEPLPLIAGGAPGACCGSECCGGDPTSTDGQERACCGADCCG